jgi:hypothetical protein
VLDPSQKDAYFKKYWGTELHAQVLKNAEQLVGFLVLVLTLSHLCTVQGALHPAVW